MNTKPSTPFGHFFEEIGVWHPHAEDTIIALYNKLHDDEKIAVEQSSGIIAILNTALKATPDFVYTLIEKKYPSFTKENATNFLNNLNSTIAGVDSAIPDTPEEAITKAQNYFSKYNGNTWVSVVQEAVSIGTDVLLKGQSPVTVLPFVLDYVYYTFIKGKI